MSERENTIVARALKAVVDFVRQRSGAAAARQKAQSCEGRSSPTAEHTVDKQPVAETNNLFDEVFPGQDCLLDQMSEEEAKEFNADADAVMHTHTGEPRYHEHDVASVADLADRIERKVAAGETSSDE